MSSSTLERNIAENSEMVSRSSNATIAGYQDLAKAYQNVATHGAERLSAAMQALAGVKSPREFVDLQKKLIADGFEAAVRDGNHIAKLSGAIFAAAFEPVRERLDPQSDSAKK